MSLVESALRFLQNKDEKPPNSIEAKRYFNPLPHLGDRVSVAILKIYDRNELIQSENARAYLTIVRNAFSDRRLVSDKLDLDPKITLFVLEYLQEREVADSEIEKRIEYMTVCVKEFSCSSQGEYDFFKKH